MSAGAKVVAWEVEYSNACEVTYNESLALSREAQGLAVRPLILQADHLAELQAAREEGRREGLERAVRGCSKCSAIRALLPDPPTPENHSP